MNEIDWKNLASNNWLHKMQSQTLDQAIEESLNRLRVLNRFFSYEPGFDAWIEHWSHQIRIGLVSNEALAEQWANFILKQGKNSDAVPFIRATIFTCMAKDAAEKGKLENAWPLLNYASFCSGLAEAISWRFQGTQKEHREVAQLGGQERSDRYAEIKQEVIRLLNKPPSGGWPPPKKTAGLLKDEISEFIKSKKFKFTFPDISDTIERWLGNNDSIRAAYESYKAN